MTMTDGEEAGKLFVGGLSWETSKEALQKYFSRYGEVVDSVVMKNNETGRSRGFGFVTFKDSSCVSIVLSAGPHELDGRTIDPKACTPRSQQKDNFSGGQQGKKPDALPKIFLGGLPANITETEIRSAFSKYGRVSDVVIMYDQEKKRSRGFGFLSFDNEDSIDQACAEHYVIVSGKQIECKRAEPRDMSRRGGGGRSQQSNSSNNQWNNRGGGMNQGQSWGQSAMPSTAPAPNGMMPGGYQAGWGAPPQQPAYTPSGGWPSQTPAAGYNSGYQNWSAPQAGYGSYAGAPAAAATTQYSQPSYPSYGPPSGGYGYGQMSGAPPTSAPPQGTGDGLDQSQQSSAGDASAQSQSSNTYGYSQDSTSYGPSRGYSSGGDTSSHGYGSSQDYGSSTGYGSQSTSQTSRGQSQGQQSYHPYRR